MKQILCLFALCAVLSCSSSSKRSSSTASPHDTLRKELQSIVSRYKATIGVGLLVIEDKDTVTPNNNHHYPMQSVYKVPLAMAVLHEVDSGKYSLDHKIVVDKKDLHPETWSPLRDDFPNGTDLTLAKLIDYTVAKSDNNGCDILFSLIGGTKAVDTYIHKIGINEINIVATEDEMHKGWNAQFTNWVQPLGMVNLLNDFYHKKHLSDTCSAFLMKCMVESSNSATRIKGLLPEGTIVAHKTGTSGANDQGVSAATNDVGIITLPNGKHLAIAVFVSNSLEQHDVNEKIIAEVAKASFDYFAK